MPAPSGGLAARRRRRRRPGGRAASNRVAVECTPRGQAAAVAAAARARVTCSAGTALAPRRTITSYFSGTQVQSCACTRMRVWAAAGIREFSITFFMHILAVVTKGQGSVFAQTLCLTMFFCTLPADSKFKILRRCRHMQRLHF